MDTIVFGRKFVPDDRDKLYPLRALLVGVDTSLIIEKYWEDNFWNGNQGPTPQCVGYAWAHWVENDPIVYLETGPEVNPTAIYDAAQKIDEWAGEDKTKGTSVRAAAKVLVARGNISSYHWAETIDDVVNTVLALGPIVVGTDWHRDMSRPDTNGIIKPTGGVVGGHAYLINGYSTVTGMFRIKNSWGLSWGKAGHAYISKDDLRYLLAGRGEACLAKEVRTAPNTPMPRLGLNWFVRLYQKVLAFIRGLFS